MSEGEITPTLAQLERDMRQSQLEHLRRCQQYSSALKGIAGDRAIVQRYGVADWPKVELDPSKPEDMESMMQDTVDIYKEIIITRSKIQGRGSVNLRDSGISECSERWSQLSFEDFNLSTPVENEESHDEKILQVQAEASLSARSQRSGTRREIEDETDTEGTDTHQPPLAE